MQHFRLKYWEKLKSCLEVGKSKANIYIFHTAFETDEFYNFSIKRTLTWLISSDIYEGVKVVHIALLALPVPVQSKKKQHGKSIK